MGKTFTAIFDGKVLKPEEPVDLKPNTRVRVTIEDSKPPTEETNKEPSFLKTALSLNLDGPVDWSERFEEYLYGNENEETD